MWLFPNSQAVAEVEAVPLTPAEQLAELEAEYRQAEAEFNSAHQELFAYAKTNPDSRSVFLNGNLFARIAAMSADPTRAQLEATRARRLARRNSLLSERAVLLKSLGAIR